MTWPNYSKSLRKDVDELLKKGGSLSAYRANPQVGVEPVKDSWAWRLERDIEKRFRVKHAVAVNSGTAALHCALVGSGITSGEVVTSPFTFSATVSAIVLAGATPVFADVDPYRYTITRDTIKRVVSRRTACILPVDLFGGIVPHEEVCGFGIPVIQDSCQSVGASIDGAFSGSRALAAAYSFNGGKQVPAGEAGVMVTNIGDVAARVRLLMNHGENFGSKQVGYNYRPNEVTCCIAWHGLQELEERNARRRKLAAYVRQGLFDRSGIGCGIPGLSEGYGTPGITVRTPVEPSTDEDHVYYVFPFTLHNMDRGLFIKRMAKRGIPVGAGYITPPLHKYPAFRKYQRCPLPVVEELSAKTLCILSTLTPDRPLSYADNVAKAIEESVR